MNLQVKALFSFLLFTLTLPGFQAIGKDLDEMERVLNAFSHFSVNELPVVQTSGTPDQRMEQLAHQLRKLSSSDVAFDNQYTSYFLEFADIVEDELGKSPELVQNEFQMQEYLKKRMDDYFELYIKPFDMDEASKSRFKKVLTKFKWKEVSKFVTHFINPKKVHEGAARKVSKARQKASVFFMKNGLGVGFGAIFGFLCNHALGAIFVLNGLNLAFVINQAFPWPIIMMAPSLWVKQKAYDYSLSQLLGGRENLKTFKKQMKEFRQKLKLQGSNHLLYPLASNEKATLVAAINSSNFFKESLEKLGIKTKGITLNKVQKFLEEQKISDENIGKAISNPDFPHNEKIHYILGELSNRSLEDSDLRKAFYLEFSEYLQVIKNDNEWPLLRAWTEDLLNQNDIEGIRRVMKNVPEGANPRLVSMIWTRMKIPQLTEKIPLKVSIPFANFLKRCFFGMTNYSIVERIYGKKNIFFSLIKYYLQV